MAAAAFLPTLSAFDIERAAQLIQQAYAPANLSPDDHRRLQQELFDIQKRPEAWGLVVPFLESQDPNVQFFGAHTAQVKIARYWDSFPQEHAPQLRDLVLELTAHSVLAGRNKVILRKLFVALTSLAFKLAPAHPSQWPDWLLGCISFFSTRGLHTEHILDFLSITAEEVGTADLVGASKGFILRSLLDAVPLVTQAITSSITRPRDSVSQSELHSALKCLEAWIPTLPASNLTPLIPLLINLLNPSPSGLNGTLQFDEPAFISASDVLQEVMIKSAFSDGAGSATITEPLLLWLQAWGGKIVEETSNSGSVDAVFHSFCKLLIALGDHSTAYLAFNLVSSKHVSPTPPLPPLPMETTSLPRSRLVQTFLRLLLSYTALPGHYGVDEEESEMTLGFWYLFQEALWNSDYYVEGEEEQSRTEERETDVWVVAKALYSELVQVLRRKVTWPERGSRWTKDQVDKFQVYRRDVGDTLINAFYVLRDSMLAYLTNDIVERLAARQETGSWVDIEATLHCISSIQEAIPVEQNEFLSRLFGPEVFGRLPTTGSDRIRRTALGLIGAYSSWFTTQPTQPQLPSSPPLLMNAISYVVSALSEPALCFAAANSLRDLCDANRAALAPHIGAFAELHAGLTGIPDTEKSKVLQSIASVIQALPPEEEIPPVEAIVNPVLQKLLGALQSSAQLPEEARTVAILQLQTLSGVAKGLTKTTESLLIFDETPEEQGESDRLKRARDDIRMTKLREGIFAAIRHTIELWSTDAGVGDALSDLIKSITSLPTDLTLISLPPGPLLELICIASRRQLNAVWLSLASMLILQLDPPTFLPQTLKSGPNEDARLVVRRTLPDLLQTSLNSLGQPGAMEENPDIVQAFFGCMDTLAHHFVSAFYQLPQELFDALMQCTIGSLALQERYSLVAACTFLGTLVNRTSSSGELSEAKALLVQRHGRPLMHALLCGFAGIAPRSATVNMVDLLSTFVGKWPAESKAWMADIVFSDDFVPSKAGPETKEKFVKAVLSSRSAKRTREAAQQFILVARGLDGSGFGYASASM